VSVQHRGSRGADVLLAEPPPPPPAAAREEVVAGAGVVAVIIATRQLRHQGAVHVLLLPSFFLCVSRRHGSVGLAPRSKHSLQQMLASFHLDLLGTVGGVGEEEEGGCSGGGGGLGRDALLPPLVLEEEDAALHRGQLGGRAALVVVQIGAGAEQGGSRGTRHRHFSSGLATVVLVLGVVLLLLLLLMVVGIVVCVVCITTR
jgi:hypothetical protein